MSNLLLPRANWVMNPNVASGNDKTFIVEEIRLALKEEGFTDFCERAIPQGVRTEASYTSLLEDFQKIEGLGATEFDSWCDLWARYKNIKEDGE